MILGSDDAIRDTTFQKLYEYCPRIVWIYTNVYHNLPKYRSQYKMGNLPNVVLGGLAYRPMQSLVF